MFVGEPIIILNRPKYMGNVGMVCRLISNFGLEPLRILGSPFERSLEMKWMAHGAEEELERITFFENFWDCIKDLELVIGTGVIHGRDRAKFINFPTLKEKIKNKRFGIIFGREDTGIQKGVSELCDFMIDFSLTGKQKSMNLAQAVAYFLGKISIDIEHIETIQEIPNKEQYFENKDINFSKNNVQKTYFLSYAQKIFGILGMNNFHGSENLATKRFKNILRFSELTQGDINFLFKMFKSIETKITKNNYSNEE